MTGNPRRIGWFVLLLCLASAPAFAQGTTAALTGVVVDKDSGVIPGATVVVKNNATGVSTTVVTNADGAYSLPALDPGTYTVTVSLQSFKTASYNDVRLLQSQTANLHTVLEVGAITDTVVVRSETSLVRTQSPTVSSTITHEFIQNVPRSDRSVLSFMVFLPGVDTPGSNSRGSTISGLPQNTINILIDGVSTENNLMSGDGFFSLVTPRQDAVEEVTLTTAAAGADQSAQGSATIRFVTRSGTNVYKGTVYEYFRHASLNANTFANGVLNRLAKPQQTVDQYGGSLGGPIVIPGVADGRGRAFFFFNQEESWQPNERSRTRTVLRDDAVLGNFSYNLVNPNTVNVLQLAKAKGQISTVDPTIAALLAQIQSSMQTSGVITPSATNLNTNSYAWLVPVSSVRHSPTGSVDFNLTSKHHLKGTYYWQRFSDSPDTLNSAEETVPGFPAHAGQHSYRTTGSVTLRSTLSSNMVNEVLSGWQWSPVDFFGDATPAMFVNQGGFFLGLPSVGSQLTNIGSQASGPEARNTVNWNLDDNFSWLKGNHNFKFGGDWTRITNWIDDWNVVPQANIGFNQTNDPANSMFTTANFPGATSGDLNNARNLYALLTGRVTSIPASAWLNEAGDQYIYNGHDLRKELMDEFGFYATDSWRWKPNVTITAGLRYELQLPMRETNGAASMTDLNSLCGISGVQASALGRDCNIFNPGSILASGVVPTFTAYNANSPGYHTDFNNFGPSVGLSYRPNVKSGFGRALLGDPEQATLSAGYTRTFNRERIDRFQNVYEALRGPSITATRGTSTGNYCLVCAGESWPLLFSQKDRLGAPAFPATPEFPITGTVSDSLRIFTEDIQVPYTDSWTAGFQRSLGKNMAVEVRYIGNENKKPWASENWNTPNWVENGILDEFKIAQANLRANVLAGRGGTFAYMGPNTGTSPLPIFLASFSGQPSGNAVNQALYTSTQFTNSTWVDRLDPYAADPEGIASNLWTGNSGTWRNNALKAGLPANFFVMNPSANGAQVWRNLGGSTYNSLQIDLRRRFSQGLQVQASYTYARRWALENVDLHLPLMNRRSTSSQPQAFKVLWVYDVPVGRGRRYGADFNKWVNGLVGGWQFSGAGRVQAPLFRLTNTKLVGISFDEAQKEFKNIRILTDPDTGVVTVWNMPQDIIDNTRRAFNTDVTTDSGFANDDVPSGRYFAPACGPEAFGYNAHDCAPDLFFYGKWFGEFDFKFTKRFPLGFKNAVFDFDVEVFNALNAINFNQSLSPSLQSANANVFRITSQASSARTGQLVWRVSW